MPKDAHSNELKRQLIREILKDPDVDLSPESAKLLLKAFDKKQQDNKPHRVGKVNSPPAHIRALVAEMASLGIGSTELHICYRSSTTGAMQVARPIGIVPPAREHIWTADLRGFESAWNSAVQAKVRILAVCQALQCSFNANSPHIEQTLFQIRAGVIKPDDNRIAELARYGQQIGRGATIFKEISDAQNEAKRRKNDGSLLPDINVFRHTLAHFWIGCLFWQMSDANITAFMAVNNLFPEGFKVNRSTVSGARKQLGLVKGEQQVVKSVGNNCQWFFGDGYPPQP